ncbi:MAG TPA: hypothetical protein VGO40_03270 [Longimicrobium sp.]|jgi:hypothetical protein|nr:hypothetical protein [Longimicrobium sp.]
MRIHRNCIALLLLAAAACAEDPTRTSTPPVEPGPPKAPTPVGVYEITVTGIGSGDLRSSISSPRPDGPRPVLAVAGSGIVFEQVASSSFTEGARGQGGQRYISFTYRVRNGTLTALNNLTMLMVSRSGTIAGTPLSSLKRFDGVAADPAIAPLIVPTGAVTMGSDLVTMQSPYPDVIQVLTEPEVAAISPPGDVTGIFPYGYVVRSAASTTNRTIPATADPNQFGGLLTLSFRLPLQASSGQDVFSLTFQVMAVDDSEIRLTESIEESQDTGAVRRLHDRATALGATTVTVLNGSPAVDAAVPDYPGQRQICSPRTAGPAGSPVTTIVSPGAYSDLMILRPGETLDACTAYFRSGSPGRPATNVPFTVTVKAVDRYGNVKTAQVDTVHMDQLTGPPYVAGASAALVSGSANQVMTYSDYGVSQLLAVGKRLKGDYPITVAGVTRIWTAGAATTDWPTNLNWSPAAVPMAQDSVYIPASAALFPLLTLNVQVEGVTVEEVATLNLGAFNLTATANVTAGNSGGITNTSGQLILAGTGKTVQGRVPRLRVTGTYSLTGNVTARAPIQVDAGRLTASAFRLQADAN